MAEFKSKYQALGFYVNGTIKYFRHGRYRTEDTKEIEILSDLSDVVRVDEPKQEKKAEEPAPVKAPAKKPSAK